MSGPHPLQKLFDTLDPAQRRELQLDPIEILAGDRTLITYRPKLNQLTGSVTATILLQQIMHWWVQMRRSFYKFKEPCAHPDYRVGDSWTEELGFTKYEFDGALQKIGVKVTRKCGREEALKNGLVIYWTDMDRRTWYEVNEPLLRQKLIELYSGPQAPETSSGNPSEPTARKADNPLYVKPKSPFSYAENPTLPTSENGAYINPNSPPSNIRNTKTTQQKQQTKKTIPPLPSEEAPRTGTDGTRKEEADEALVTRKEAVIRVLTANGVFAAPAAEIAEQAIRSGLDAEAVEHAFKRHLKQTSKVELAIWRLREGLFDPSRNGLIAGDLQQLFEGSQGEERLTKPERGDTVWEQVIDILRGQMTTATFETHLRGSYQVAQEEDHLVVAVQGRTAVAWLQGPRYWQVSQALQQVTGSGTTEVRFVEGEETQ
jgi:hypothetical protein